MRRAATAAIILIAMVLGARTPALAQTPPPNNRVPPPIMTRSATITPLGAYAVGGIVCAAVTPMLGTIILGREMTSSEVGQSTLGCFLGPIGWLLAPTLFPPEVITVGNGNNGPNQPPRQPRTPRTSTTQARNISIPPPGETGFVPDEVLSEFNAGTSPQYIANFASALQVTPLETQTFALTGRISHRWRIIGNNSVRTTLRGMLRFNQISAGQVNHYYHGMQAQPPATQNAAPAADPAQYVVPKLHLLEAHRITNGDDVLVAVIDSQIDTQHPDLAGVFAGEFDALGTSGPAHAHGTGMAGAIAAHAKLLGVAPKVKLLAVRAFSGEKESAQGTTFNILKALDWAAGKGARIVNMSFAGPGDPMLRDMLAKAHERGIVLMAAVGNAGPRSPPLYPAADPFVIGVTADRCRRQASAASQSRAAGHGGGARRANPGAGA